MLGRLPATIASLLLPAILAAQAVLNPLANTDANYHALRNAAPTETSRVENIELKRDVATITLRSGAITIDAVLKVLDDGALKGLGGAGFPAGRKWRSVRAEPGPRLMAVNGDEGEPGTFKDQFFLNTDPHRFLEGTLIGAHVVEASDVYIYIRDEYPIARQILATDHVEYDIGPLPASRLHRAGDEVEGTFGHIAP